jgi:hypothetical protein
MKPEWDREIYVVAYTSGTPDPERLEARVCLSSGDDFPAFIDALKRASPNLYEEVRRRVMRAAGRVLAYGRDDPLLITIDRKIAEGGTLLFPAEPSHVGEAELAESAPRLTRSELS